MKIIHYLLFTYELFSMIIHLYILYFEVPIKKGYCMALHSSKVADKILSYMNKNNTLSLAVPWADFYTLTERGAIREAFMKELSQALKDKSLLISYGQTIIGIMKDYSPPNIKHDFK